MALVNPIVLFRIEHPADGRFHAEHREVIAGHHFGLDALGLVVDTDRGRHQPPAQHFGQRLGLLLEVLIERIRMHPRAHIAAVVTALLVQHHELVRGADGQLAQQNLVDQREDRGIGADAQGERQDRDNREERASAQTTEGQSEVGEDGGHRAIRRAQTPERLLRTRDFVRHRGGSRVTRGVALPAGHGR